MIVIPPHNANRNNKGEVYDPSGNQGRDADTGERRQVVLGRAMT